MHIKAYDTGEVEMELVDEGCSILIYLTPEKVDSLYEFLKELKE